MQGVMPLKKLMIGSGIVTTIIIIITCSRKVWTGPPELVSELHSLSFNKLSSISLLHAVKAHHNASAFNNVGTPHDTSDCDVPVGGYKSWNTGVVTALYPEIKRNCTKIFAGDEDEIQRIAAKSKNWHNDLTDEEFLALTKNCSWIFNYFYDNLYTTKLEHSFPIAYGFVVYNSPQQVMRLLKFLYRPGNTYCIHPDQKSEEMIRLFRNVAKCLDNVFVASNLINVTWRQLSLLQAQMSCYSDLLDWRSKQPEQKQWKYVINLCGKELPLKSTHTIASYLSALNGSSSLIARRATTPESLSRCDEKKIPHNFLYYKTIAYTALSYQFVHFMMNNHTAIELYHFFEGCQVPEEHFYATLFRVPGVPGGYDSSKEKLYIRVASCTWLTTKPPPPCSGRRVHNICIVTVGDLKMILEVQNKNVTALFHNKYFMEDDHTIMDCMEERLVEANKIEHRQDCSNTWSKPEQVPH